MCQKPARQGGPVSEAVPCVRELLSLMAGLLTRLEAITTTAFTQVRDERRKHHHHRRDYRLSGMAGDLFVVDRPSAPVLRGPSLRSHHRNQIRTPRGTA